MTTINVDIRELPMIVCAAGFYECMKDRALDANVENTKWNIVSSAVCDIDFISAKVRGNFTALRLEDNTLWTGEYYYYEYEDDPDSDEFVLNFYRISELTKVE